MQFYWILTSHIVSIFPIGQCLWTFKNHKTYDSLLTFLHLAFTVFFSICYHTDDYSDIEVPLNSRPVWTILDHWSSSICIVEGAFYGLKVREPIIYIMSYASGTILLFLKVADQKFASHFYVFLSIFLTMIFKYRITLKYFKKYYIRSLIALSCGSIATYSIYAPNFGYDYVTWHPIWHTCIFITSFMTNSLRHSYDKELLDKAEYTRTASDSI